MYLTAVQICTCVGETILSRCPGASLNEYVPLYLSKATMDNQVSSVCSRIVFHYFNAANVDTPVLLHCTGETTNLSVQPNTFSEDGDRY